MKTRGPDLQKKDGDDIMARAPDEMVGKAKEMYLNGMKLVEIASQLNRPEGTIRRWKSTYKWEEERSGEAGERSEKTGERSKNKANVRKEKKKVVAEDVRKVMENPNLTEKQRLFCLYYVRCFNATKAYQKAYQSSYETSMVEGCKLLRNPKVKAEILELKQNRLNRELLDESDIFQKYMEIAFADMNDFVDIHRSGIMPKSNIDGTIITEISDTANGIKIKLADRMKALEWIDKHMGLATEEQRERVGLLKAQRKKLEHDLNTVKTTERNNPFTNLTTEELRQVIQGG